MQTYLKVLNLWYTYQAHSVECVLNLSQLSQLSFNAIYGAVRIMLTHLLYDDWKNKIIPFSNMYREISNIRRTKSPKFLLPTKVRLILENWRWSNHPVVYARDRIFVIALPADVRAPTNARPSAGIMLTEKFAILKVTFWAFSGW